MRYFLSLMFIVAALAILITQKRYDFIERKTSSAPDQNVVRFFALGDTGTGDPDQYAVANTIAKKCEESGCDFGVLLGDNFYPEGVTSLEDPQWQLKFKIPYANIQNPFYVVLGNHDYNDGRNRERGAIQIAYSQIDPKWIMPKEYYKFEKGNALFLALDTQAISFHYNDSFSEQEGFVAETLKNPHPSWVIALGHHTYLSNGTNKNARGAFKEFIDRYICNRADFYIGGHDHDLQIFDHPDRCKTYFVVSGGGGYGTYALTNETEAMYQKRSLGFAYIVIEGNKLHLEFIDDHGLVLFARDFLK